MAASGVRLTASFDDDTSAAAGTLRDDICISKDAEPIWRSNAQANDEILLQYFGTQSGSFRIFPLQSWPSSSSGCNAYDPRRRPWYVAAASGPKNVIVVLDRSGSMAGDLYGNLPGPGEFSRMDLAKIAAADVVSTLTSDDYFAVVGFSDDSASQTVNIVSDFDTSRRPVLQHASNANKEAAVRAIEQMSYDPQGLTYYHRGVERALDILEYSLRPPQTTELRTAADCMSVILFLTDGNPTDTQVESLLQQRWADYDEDAVILTYRLGTGSNNNNPLVRRMACHTGGFNTDVSFSGRTQTEVELNLREVMASYYQYLGAMQDRSNQVVWTEPYEDAAGMGLVVSAAMPVYYSSASSTDALPLLAGVAAVDMTVTQLQEYESSLERLAAIISSRSATCSAAEPTQCQRQELRVVRNAGTTENTDAVCDPEAVDPSDSSRLRDFFSFSTLPPSLAECRENSTAPSRDRCEGVASSVTAICDGTENRDAELGCCPVPADATAVIVGAAVGAVVVVVISVVACCFCCKRSGSGGGSGRGGSSNMQSGSTANRPAPALQPAHAPQPAPAPQPRYGGAPPAQPYPPASYPPANTQAQYPPRQAPYPTGGGGGGPVPTFNV